MQVKVPLEKKKTLDRTGFFIQALELPAETQKHLLARDWQSLDMQVSGWVQKGGLIFNALALFETFTQIEFIISIRSSLEFPDEDGIWHDDGSRPLAFSLSLTLAPEEIEGGVLEIRKKGSEDCHKILTPPYGHQIVFRTGVQGFEHKIGAVRKGERIIIAGWCS